MKCAQCGRERPKDPCLLAEISEDEARILNAAGRLVARFYYEIGNSIAERCAVWATERNVNLHFHWRNRGEWKGKGGRI